SLLSARSRRPPAAPLFPYTTLFRSTVRRHRIPRGGVRGGGGLHSRPGLLRRVVAGYVRPRGAGSLRGEDQGPLNAPHLAPRSPRSEEHTSELQSRENLVCRLLLEKK